MTNDFCEEEPHYLLDSNVISEIIKPTPRISVLKKIAEHASDCAICTPVWEELKFGIHLMTDGLNKKCLEKFICEDVHENFKIKNYTEKAADIHAMLRAELCKSGRPTQKGDSMIASIAIANHMILVTRNTKHFTAIQEISELQIENWFEPPTPPLESPTPPQSNGVWCSHKVLQSDLIPLVSPLLATQFQDEGRGIKPSARIKQQVSTQTTTSTTVFPPTSISFTPGTLFLLKQKLKR